LPNRSWDVLAAMMGKRGIMVRTASAPVEVVGKRHYGKKALPHGGGGGRQATRALFDTLLLWRAYVPLDERGQATLDVPLNDSLTSFRIGAVATGSVQQFGTGATTIRTTQDLMLFSGLPPVVRQGDRFRAGFTVRNVSDHALDVRLAPSVEGLPGPLDPQALSLAAGASSGAGGDVAAPPDASVLRWTLAATAGASTHRLAPTHAGR